MPPQMEGREDLFGLISLVPRLLGLAQVPLRPMSPAPEVAAELRLPDMLQILIAVPPRPTTAPAGAQSVLRARFI